MNKETINLYEMVKTIKEKNKKSKLTLNLDYLNIKSKLIIINGIFHLNLFLDNVGEDNLIIKYDLYTLFLELLFSLGSMSMSITVKQDNISDNVKSILSEFCITYLPEIELEYLSNYIKTK